MQQVVIEVRNTETEIHFAPPELLKMIDVMTSYPDPGFEGLQTLAGEYNQADVENAWDGIHHLLHQPKIKAPWVPSGLRDLVVECCERMNIPFMLQDVREAPELDVPHYLKPIPLWDHQKEACDAAVDNPDGVIVLPPRGGKTRCLLEVHRRLSLPTLWIAPTSSIVAQTVSRAREFFAEHDVQKIGTKPEHVHYSAQLCITTAAAAMALPQEFMDTRKMLVGDELHHFLANNKWGSGLSKKTKHIYYRYGMTGTFFRSSGDDLAMHAFLSRTLYEISTRELMAKGFLVPTYMAFIKIPGPQARRGMGSQKFHGPGGIGYNGIHTHKYRNQVVAECVHKLHQLGKNVLVLVGAKVQGNALQSLLRDLIPPAPMGTEFESVEFVSTDRKRVTQDNIIRSFTEGQEVKVLIGTSLVGEGVDLPNADALVYARGEKAAVTYIQGLFRVCTKAPGKEFGIIVDFADLHAKTLEKHSKQRWNLASTEPLFRLSYLDSPKDFDSWVVGGESQDVG